jgi:hypothetical protein
MLRIIIYVKYAVLIGDAGACNNYYTSKQQLQILLNLISINNYH